MSLGQTKAPVGNLSICRYHVSILWTLTEANTPPVVSEIANQQLFGTPMEDPRSLVCAEA